MLISGPILTQFDYLRMHANCSTRRLLDTSGVAKGRASGDMPWGAGLGRTSTLFAVI